MLYPYPEPDVFCTACYSTGHDVVDCDANPYRPSPAGTRGDAASRVLTERRPRYAIKIGKRRRRYDTRGAAYYALAKYLIGAKYMGPLSVVHGLVKKRNGVDRAADLARICGIPEELVEQRAARAMELFVEVAYDHPAFFDSGRWQEYVRRVAKKLQRFDALAIRRSHEAADRVASNTSAPRGAMESTS